MSPSTFYYFLNGRQALTRSVNVNDFTISTLLQSGVSFTAVKPATNVLGLLWSAAYLYILYRMLTQLQGPRDENVGKSREDMNLGNYAGLSFDEVAGQDRAKLEVKEICDMLRSPDTYTRLGARLPSGVLLCGPPGYEFYLLSIQVILICYDTLGTGKTLLARVTATEAKVPFYACSATDFVEIFVGRGPARIRKLFDTAIANAPCIIFIDEIDSIGRSRRAASLNSEQENSLNQLLTCMDGLGTSNNDVIVMAATNRAELLDPALLRPGRFDRLVQCTLPDKLVLLRELTSILTQSYLILERVD